MKISALIVISVLLVGCARNPNAALAPTSVRVGQAYEMINVIGAIQEAAIRFNAQTICGADTVCAPMLSTDSTRIVVRICGAAVTSIRRAPEGWTTVGQDALTQISNNLGASGQLRLDPYITAARVVLAGVTVFQGAR